MGGLSLEGRSLVSDGIEFLLRLCRDFRSWSTAYDAIETLAGWHVDSRSHQGAAVCESGGELLSRDDIRVDGAQSHDRLHDHRSHRGGRGRVNGL